MHYIGLHKHYAKLPLDGERYIKAKLNAGIGSGSADCNSTP